MTRSLRFVLLTAFSLAAGWTSSGWGQQKTRQASYLRSLAALNPIDAHAHVWKNDPEFNAMLGQLNLLIIDVLYDDDKDPSILPLDRLRAVAMSFVQSAHGRASLCTTFDPFQFNQPDFVQGTIEGLDRDFAAGAIAVKIWKNIGMEVKDREGHYVLADDARFDAIYREIEFHNKTLLAHQAEPDVAWGPPDPKALDSSYYAKHPEWNMEKIPGAPSKRTILEARDHLLAEHPHLRVVGAHLGSMEADVDKIAETLDHYPNLAIDTGARVAHLTIQPSSKVRAFLMNYQDRVLYGTDIEFSGADTGKAAVAEWKRQLALDWRYFATAETFMYKGRVVHGLNLPPEVLTKIYHANAIHWFPGVESSAGN